MHNVTAVNRRVAAKAVSIARPADQLLFQQDQLRTYYKKRDDSVT